MLYVWMILAAALGQATQPAEDPPAPGSGGSGGIIVRPELIDQLLAAEPEAPATQPAGQAQSAAGRQAGAPMPRATTRPALPVSVVRRNQPATRPADRTQAEQRPLRLAQAEQPPAAGQADDPAEVPPPAEPQEPPPAPPVRIEVAPPLPPDQELPPPDEQPAPPDEARPPEIEVAPEALALPEALEQAAAIGTLAALSGAGIDVEVTADGTIIISAETPEDLQILQDFIRQLDRIPVPVQFEIFKLEGAQATTLAPQLQTFWTQAKTPIRGPMPPEDRITVIPEPRSNSLMVAATEENLPQIAGIIRELDQPVEVTFVPVALQHIRAVEAAGILRTLLEARQRQLGPGAVAVEIQADVRTNSLLISAPRADLEQIRALIEVIDAEPRVEARDAARLMIVPLEKAVAADLATVLNNLLQLNIEQAQAQEQDIRRLRMQVQVRDELVDLPPLDLERPIRVLPDPGTNSVIVATVEANFEPLRELVSMLDGVPLADEMLVRVYRLEHADGETLMASLQTLFDQGRQLPIQPERSIPARIPPTLAGAALALPVGLALDRRTNALVVAGRPEQLLLVEQVVRAVDVPEDAGRHPPRLIQLVHADASRVAEAAQSLADQRQQLADLAGPGQAIRSRILILPDARTNSLIVVAADPDFAEIQRIAEALDTPDIVGAEIRLATLEHADASRLADVLRRLFEEQLRLITARGEEPRPSERIAIIEDAATRTLLIAASAANHERIAGLLERLDVLPPIDAIIRTLLVRHIDVSRAADVLREVFDRGVYRGEIPPAEMPEARVRVTIVPDAAASSLIVSASPENLALVEQLLEQMDRPDLPIVHADWQVVPLRHADVVHVADLLEQMMEGIRQTMREHPEELELQIIPDLRTNALILSGARFAIRRATELIPQLDQPLELVPEERVERPDVPRDPDDPDPPPVDVPVRDPRFPAAEVRVYRLSAISASRMETLLTELFERGLPPDLIGRRIPVVILAEEAGNKLIVTASRSDHLLVDDLIRRLDVPTELGQQLEIIPLREARVEQVVDVLRQLLDEPAGARPLGFAVLPEPRTNSLLIFAPPDLMANIRRFAQELDTARPKADMALRIFTLRNQRAEELARLLDEFFQAAGAGVGPETRQLIIRFTHIDPVSGEAIIRSLVHQDIVITPDPATNSLMVLAPDASIDMMQMLIEMLDSVAPVTVEVQVFQLINADAAEMRRVLEDLLRDGERRMLLLAGADAMPAPAVPGAGAVTEVAFAVDTRTNSLIAAGSPTYLRIVDRLISQLDFKEIEERLVRVIHLRYGRSEEVTATLQGYFQAEATLLERIGDEAAVRQLQRQITIQDAGPTSNSLVVSYSPRMESQLLNMISELDQAPPQVMIHVLMAEVTLDDRFEMGVEFALQDLAFSKRAVVDERGLVRGPRHDTILGTDLGAVGVGGGFTLTVTGEDFNFLFRALQSEGRLEVLSRPSIMVRDNQEANITIGDRVPTVQDFTVTAVGTVPSVTYEEVGIILNVTPIINPDGFVNLDIEPEISAIGVAAISVGPGVSLPTFTQRRAQTSVTVKDGETIIIGGLITTRESSAETKVPILGDIPILGLAFRSTERSVSRTELLIVLTPHVIRTPEDARRMSVRMRDQTGMMDTIRLNPLMGGLQVTPDEDQFGPVYDLRPREDEDPTELMGPELEEFGPPISRIEVDAGGIAVQR